MWEEVTADGGDRLYIDGLSRLDPERQQAARCAIGKLAADYCLEIGEEMDSTAVEAPDLPPSWITLQHLQTFEARTNPIPGWHISMRVWGMLRASQNSNLVYGGPNGSSIYFPSLDKLVERIQAEAAVRGRLTHAILQRAVTLRFGPACYNFVEAFVEDQKRTKQAKLNGGTASDS